MKVFLVFPPQWTPAMPHLALPVLTAYLRSHGVQIDLFKRLILPDIKRERPDVVGISIPTSGQMLAGMTLAHLIKQAGLKCHITVGGPQISMLRDQLRPCAV